MLTYFRCVGGHIERKDEFTPESLKDAPEGTLHWIDLEDPTIKESSILEDPFHFHPLAIEDTLAEVHHPKLDDYDAYIYVIVHGMRFDAPTDQFITRELDVFLGPELPRHPPQRAHALDQLHPRPVRQGHRERLPQGLRLPAAPHPGPDVRPLLPEPRCPGRQDPAHPGGGLREPDQGHAGPDLRPQEGHHPAPPPLLAAARDREPPGPCRPQGHQRARRRLLPRHLRQSLPDRGGGGRPTTTWCRARWMRT